MPRASACAAAAFLARGVSARYRVMAAGRCGVYRKGYGGLYSIVPCGGDAAEERGRGGGTGMSRYNRPRAARLSFQRRQFMPRRRYSRRVYRQNEQSIVRMMRFTASRNNPPEPRRRRDFLCIVVLAWRGGAICVASLDGRRAGATRRVAAEPPKHVPPCRRESP